MSKLDPQLAFLMDNGTTVLESTSDAEASYERFGVESASRKSSRSRGSSRPSPTVTVLAQYAGDVATLKKAGLTVHSVAGDVVTGTISLSDVSNLEKLAEVERIEAARSMQIELDVSLVETRANLVHTGPPGRRGAGVIVGICDTGCDFTHPSFRRSDGSSRILFIWAQGLTPQAGESSPAGLGYGVEYTNAQINSALALANPFTLVRHRDPGGHGSHVTGIAAGDGQPGSAFVGVAPEADIIIVANASNGSEGLGTSASTLDAVNYMFQKSAALGKPCVVNMSLGDNLGPHDGTTLLERGLDNLLGAAGRAFVKSAGNAGAARCHAEGIVTTGVTADVRFNQPAGDGSMNQIDLWYRGSDVFRVSVVDPAGNLVGPVNVGSVTSFTLPGGNTVRIDHRNNDPFNGDKRVFMTFGPGAAGVLRDGNWTIRIVALSSPGGGRFDAWIQRGQVVPSFLAPHESSARTISTPGTAREVITAANYITKGAGVGSLATSSSRGPTRDGRLAPTLAAPGMWITSANGEGTGTNAYRPDGGTSMAAPHITGAIALMLQKNPSRTQAQIIECLTATARSDAQTGPVPNTAWGAGKLDANAAVNCVPARLVVRSVVPCPSWVCPPRTLVSCPPRSLLRCPSVPAAACTVQSVVGCTPPVSLARCPSVVDGCPSTPGGCNFQSVVNCGTQSVVCGGPGRLPGGGVIQGGQEGAEQASELPPGWDASPQPDSTSQPTPPAHGYFDYDEGWFDDPHGQ